MNPTDLMSVFLRGALGSRGRKRARRASQFVTGNKGFLTTSTLLTAAGLAWGVYDSLKSSSSAPLGGPSGSGQSPSPPPGTASGGPLPAGWTGSVPPLPVDAATPLPTDVLRLVRLAVSAARADGALSAEERALIVQHARQAGIEQDVERELSAPHPVADIVRGVDDLDRRQDLYVLAFAIVRADESVSGAERIYLAQLAHQLRLDAAMVATLEQRTASQIDALNGGEA